MRPKHARPHRLWDAIPAGAPARSIDRLLTDARGHIRRGLFLPGAKDKKKRLYYIAFRDGWACGYCGHLLDERRATVDHIYPRSRGGRNHVRNLTLACNLCNATKGTRTPAEWRAAQGARP